MVNRIVVLDDSYTTQAQVDAALPNGYWRAYSFKNTFGVSGTLEELGSIKGVVDSIEVDEAANLVPQISKSHLVRLFGKGLGNLPDQYQPISKGSGESVYLIDSGVRSSHSELIDSNIVNLHSNFGRDYDDSNGHGTAMASLIVGKNLGAASGATLYNVKAFDGGSIGTVTLGDIFDALESVLAHHLTNTPSKAKTVCMPWKIDKNDFIDRMVLELNNNNLICVAASGNDGVDVDTISPAGVEEILTVGAVDDKFIVTPYASNWGEGEGAPNYGSAMDIWAPGIDVAIADINSLSSYSMGSGSSISCAIVAAICTHYTKRYPELNSNQVKATILTEGAVPGKILIGWNLEKLNVTNINYNLIKTDQAGQVQLSGYPSGRLLNIKQGEIETFDLQISSSIKNLVSLEFSPLPPWIQLSDDGVLTINVSNLEAKRVPGVYIFAIKGDSPSGAIIEEYSVGVYAEKEAEVWDATSYFYDLDLNEYDVAEDFDIVTYTQLKG